MPRETTSVPEVADRLKATLDQYNKEAEFPK